MAIVKKAFTLTINDGETKFFAVGDKVEGDLAGVLQLPLVGR